MVQTTCNATTKQEHIRYVCMCVTKQLQTISEGIAVVVLHCLNSAKDPVLSRCHQVSTPKQLLLIVQPVLHQHNSRRPESSELPRFTVCQHMLIQEKRQPLQWVSMWWDSRVYCCASVAVAMA